MRLPIIALLDEGKVFCFGERRRIPAGPSMFLSQTVPDAVASARIQSEPVISPRYPSAA